MLVSTQKKLDENLPIVNLGPICLQFHNVGRKDTKSN